jgi:hypothetical protein
VTQIPEIATGKQESIGALSGLALQILYGPLVEKTESKRRTYGDMLKEINRRLLDLGGYGPDWRVENDWAEMLPRSEVELRNTLILDGQMGASKKTRLKKLGYNSDTELAQSKLETPDDTSPDGGTASGIRT